MSPEEKNVISGIFERLKGAANAPRDAEAERFIADQIRAQPYAPYVMAQSIYAQEQALVGMQQQMEQMQARLQDLEAYAQQVQGQQQQSGGFLGGLFGGGAKAPRRLPRWDARRSSVAPWAASLPDRRPAPGAASPAWASREWGSRWARPAPGASRRSRSAPAWGSSARRP